MIWWIMVLIGTNLATGLACYALGDWDGYKKGWQAGTLGYRYPRGVPR